MMGAAIARSGPRRQYVITAEREQSTVNHSKDKSIQCYKTSLFITCFTSDMHDYIIINHVGSSHYTLPYSIPLKSEKIMKESVNNCLLHQINTAAYTYACDIISNAPTFNTSS